ncbi:MAG: stalk domain-containing protein [Clostridia bacterium]|nr:stalk domain-containing protein [Clostridia bacterium]
MKFIRSKLTSIIIVIVSVLCLIAVGISVKITITMLEKGSQVIEQFPTESQEKVQTAVKYININKIKEQQFFFNGQPIEGDTAILTERKQTLVPMDAVLRRIGIRFNYYHPDDTLETEVNRKKLVVRLGRDFFTIDDGGISLPAAPIAAKNHIFVPVELFTYLDGFKRTLHEDKNTVFINYYSGSSPDIVANIKVLRLVNGIAGVSDITGTRLYWDRKGSFERYERFQHTDDKSGYILKSGDKVYIIKYDGKITPYPADVPASAQISADGKYLYWVDEDKETSFIYDIKNKTSKELGDYYFKIKADDKDGRLSYGGDVLYDFGYGKRYKRVALTNILYDTSYGFIERRGKTVLKGNMIFSPDKKKVLCLKPDKKVYLANSDGTDIVYLGEGKEASWVNNSRVFINNGSEMTVFTDHGEDSMRVSAKWDMIGQAVDGTIFYTAYNSLYYEKNGVEKKIMDLPCSCEHVYAWSAGGPYIVVSNEKEDSVFWVTGNSIVKVGSRNLLLKEARQGKEYVDYDRSVAVSPDKKSMAVFQAEKDFISLNFVSTNEKELKKVYLNCPTSDDSEMDTIRAKWVSDKQVLVYTAKHGWIMDLKNGVSIYEWTEPEGSSIQDITIE